MTILFLYGKSGVPSSTSEKMYQELDSALCLNTPKKVKNAIEIRELS